MLTQRLERFLKAQPSTHKAAYIAPTALLMGDVRLHTDSSLWHHTVLRADLNYIEIGQGTNIQEGTVIHLADEYPVIIGKNVTVGHKAMLHACSIEDNCLIGMGATILDGAVIGEGSIIGACALITQRTVIPPRSMVLGMPGRIIRSLTDAEYTSILESAHKYIQLAKAHAAL